MADGNGKLNRKSRECKPRIMLCNFFEMCNLYGVLSLASTGNDVILRHCTCFRSFHDLRGSLVKENQYV